MGRPALFNREDEEKIVHHVIKMAKFGYGYTRSQLLYLATDMADFAKKKRAQSLLQTGGCTVSCVDGQLCGL